MVAKKSDFDVRETRVGVLALPLPNCVPIGYFLNVFEPQFPHL